MARLVDLTTGKELRKLAGLNMFSFITQYAFTPDSKVLAGWCSDQTILSGMWPPARSCESSANRPGPSSWARRSWAARRRAIWNSRRTASTWSWAPAVVPFTAGKWKPARKFLAGRPPRALLTLAISPDGKTVISRGADRVAYVWDAATAKEIAAWPCRDVTQAVFSPDGKILALGSGDGTLRIWDVKSAKEVRKWQAAQAGFNTIAYSADGKTLASRGNDLVIRLWDPATGKEQRQIGEKPNGDGGRGNDFLRNFLSSDVPAMRFSADGGTLATMPPVEDPRLINFGIGMGGNKSASLHLWDVGTGRLIRKFADHPGGFTAFAYAPDGRTLATAGSDGSIVLWEAITGKVRVQLQTAGLAPLIQGLVNRYADRALQRKRYDFPASLPPWPSPPMVASWRSLARIG